MIALRFSSSARGPKKIQTVALWLTTTRHLAIAIELELHIIINNRKKKKRSIRSGLQRASLVRAINLEWGCWHPVMIHISGAR